MVDSLNCSVTGISSGTGPVVQEQWYRTSGTGTVVQDQWYRTSGTGTVVQEQWYRTSGTSLLQMQMRKANTALRRSLSAVEILVKVNHGMSSMNALERVLTANDDGSDLDDGSNDSQWIMCDKCSLSTTEYH